MTMLLQWVWQGVAITVALWIALRCARRLNASTRYALWWAALVAVLVLPTAPGGWPIDRVSGGAVSSSASALGWDSAPAGRALVELPAPPDWLIACAIGAWLGSVLLGLGRLGRGVMAVQRLKAESRPLAISVERSMPMRREWRRAGRRRATLRVSPHISGACALGLFGRPVIVLSDRLVAAMDPADLDLIVLHEQMHLARYDDWAMLLQTGVAVFLGWHPAIRVISGALEAEREAACDEAVAARIGSTIRYAACLADAADVIATRSLAPVSVAPHAAGTGSLLARVQRLLDPRVRRRAALQWLAVGSGVTGLAVASAISVAVGPIVRADPASAAEPTSEFVARPTAASAWAMLVDEPASTPAPVAVRPGARSARRTPRVTPAAAPLASRATVATRRPAVPISVHDVDVASDLDAAPLVQLVAEPSLEPITARIITNTGLESTEPTSPTDAGADWSAAPDAERTRWATVGRQIARDGATVGQQIAQHTTAFGQQVARRSAVLGGFFGRAGKAVSGRF